MKAEEVEGGLGWRGREVVIVEVGDSPLERCEGEDVIGREGGGRGSECTCTSDRELSVEPGSFLTADKVSGEGEGLPLAGETADVSDVTVTTVVAMGRDAELYLDRASFEISPF